jgi:hypothetical protein
MRVEPHPDTRFQFESESLTTPVSITRRSQHSLSARVAVFLQLGHKLDSLWTLEVRQMITSVIAQLGFRRGRACF